MLAKRSPHAAPFQDQVEQPWISSLAPRPVPVDAQPVRRRKLWDLDSHLHCSIVGTCLSLSELRKLVVRHLGQHAAALSDLEIHEHGVRLSSDAEASRHLHRALDRKFEAQIRRFDQADTTSKVEGLWEEAKRAGDIPAAYWCVITHPATTVPLLQRVVGDVHMLSHLVGASNRADIRRLAELESRCAELQDKSERQQARLQALAAEREAAMRELAAALAHNAKTADEACTPAAPDETERLEYLRGVVAALERKLGVEERRRERAEQLFTTTRESLDHTESALASTTERERLLQAELEAAERLLEHRRNGTERDGAYASQLAGRTILYVGGRLSAIHAIRSLCEEAGCTLEHHDGGMETRRGLLDARVPRADVVMFPVDCVSHDAAWTLKRLCRQSSRPLFALRSASLSSFLAALDTWTAQQQADTGEASETPASVTCLVQG